MHQEFGHISTVKFLVRGSCALAKAGGGVTILARFFGVSGKLGSLDSSETSGELTDPLRFRDGGLLISFQG